MSVTPSVCVCVLLSGYLCVIMYVRRSWMVCLRRSGVWSSSGWTKLETEKQTFPRNPSTLPLPPPPPPPPPRLLASGAVQPVWDNVTVYRRPGPHAFVELGAEEGSERVRERGREGAGVQEPASVVVVGRDPTVTVGKTDSRRIWIWQSAQWWIDGREERWREETEGELNVDGHAEEKNWDKPRWWNGVKRRRTRRETDWQGKTVIEQMNKQRQLLWVSVPQGKYLDPHSLSNKKKTLFSLFFFSFFPLVDTANEWVALQFFTFLEEKVPTFFQL